MARTTPQRVALGVVMAFATVAGSDLCLSQGLGQAEPGIELKGKKLFETETFGGNGRTCRTCHSKRTGTLTLADVQRIVRQGEIRRPVPDSRRARRRWNRHDAGPGARNDPHDHPTAAVAVAGR